MTTIMRKTMIAFGLYVSSKIIMPIITIIRKRSGSNKDQESGIGNDEDHIYTGKSEK